MSTDTKPAKAWTKYSEADIERGLIALVRLNNSVEAAEETGIHEATLRSWTKRYPDRVARIHAEVLPELQKQMAVDAVDLTRRYAVIEHEMLDALDVSQLRPSELAQALPRIATARGISTDKANLFHDRPTSIVEHRAAPEILDALNRKIPGMIIDSTAEPIEDADVIDGDQDQLPAPSLPAL